ANTLFFFALICDLNSILGEPTPKPQLDLPPLPPSSSTAPPVPPPEQPTVLPNSYAGEPDEEPRSSRDYDSDRSQRYGPPYENDDAYYRDRDRYNDRPYNYDDRTKYSNDDDRYYRDRNQYDGYPGSGPYNNDDDRYYANRGRNPGSNPYSNDDDRYYKSNPYNDDRYRDDRYRDDRYRDDRYRDDRYRDDRYRYDDQDRRYQQRSEELARYLAEVDQKSSEECFLNVAAQWNFETNVNEATQLEALTAQQRYSEFQRVVWDRMKFVDRTGVFDDRLLRQVNLMSIIGASALPPDQLDRYNRLINDMLVIYNGASICAYEQPFQCGLRLQPHLKELMAKSRDWDELTWTWIEWRRKSGRIMRELFEQMVDLTNEAARYNNFTNGEEYWSFPFESLSFRDEMERVWNEVLPLYEMIHTYTRRKLREFYGPDKINRNAPIPDHILGNMYGQSWSNILDIIIPYPGRSFLEVTPAMNAQGYTPLVMFQLAEEFFVSLNMTPLPPQFWINSLLEEPPDRPVLCQPSAWDFCNGQDYRIKMCTTVTHKDLITAHHEMAHIQYFYNYRNMPKVFRDGANPGFHEAVGDAIGLSVSTPRHLQTLGLVHKSVDDTAHDINFLFALAMDKVVFLPFALALEAWRFDIFSKKINKEQYNCHWWLLRERYGGIKPPVLRSELDFDPGSKYHVPANIPYSR
uniref:Angiotensin-converting enzyme n=1 Tax=Phlebotomus papatasi TaxID=29031 RepID=A0A1B0GNY6_PHLPP